jgi:predicted ester cyclase
MGAAENKALVRRLFEQGMNERKLEIFDECVAPNFVNHDLPGPTPGPEGFVQSFGMFEAGFPDLQIHLGDVLAAEDNTVITRSHWTGTHKGEFMGVAASGASVDVQFIDIWRIENGLLVESWVRMDFLSLMQQVGAVPS